MKVNRVLAIGGVIVVAAAIWAVFIRGNGNTLPDTVAYGNGRVEAVQIDIATKIPGRVASVTAREGDLVKSGQTLATIDTTQLKAQLLRAEAEIASAKSQVAAAKAAIAQANAQLTFARQELDRASKLVKKGVASRERYDTRLANRDVAKANLAAAKANLLSQERRVDAIKASAHEIQSQINDCILKAPATGRVLYRLAEPGEVIGAGGKVLTLTNLARIYMEFYLPSSQAHLVSIGSEARIKLDIVEFAIPAKVTFVSPVSQFTPKQVETTDEREKLMFKVRVRVPQELIVKHIDRVKTGLRGVAYVRMNADSGFEWPGFLNKLPPDAAQSGKTQ